MSGFLANIVYDYGLNLLTGSGNRLYLSSASAGVLADLTAGSTGSCVVTTGSAGPGDGASGRMVVIPATSGSIWSTPAAGTTGCWCLANSSGPTVLASGSLASSQSTVVGNGWSLTSFNIRIPNPQ
jgi:hypothetical protein